MKRLMLLLSILLSAIIPLAQESPDPVPESYIGYATLDGEAASAGLSITVKVTNTSEIVGSSVTEEDGGFSLDIIFDNLNTTVDEGAEENDPLTWYIAGNECTTPAPGEDKANSGNSNLNFDIEAEFTGCELDGDYPPCGNVSLAEVVDFITVWDACSKGECPPGEDATLAEVVDLITVWDLCSRGQCPD